MSDPIIDRDADLETQIEQCIAWVIDKPRPETDYDQVVAAMIRNVAKWRLLEGNTDV